MVHQPIYFLEVFSHLLHNCFIFHTSVKFKEKKDNLAPPSYMYVFRRAMFRRTRKKHMKINKK
jgi:hypothetical protein